MLYILTTNKSSYKSKCFLYILDVCDSDLRLNFNCHCLGIKKRDSKQDNSLTDFMIINKIQNGNSINPWLKQSNKCDNAIIRLNI